MDKKGGESEIKFAKLPAGGLSRWDYDCVCIRRLLPLLLPYGSANIGHREAVRRGQIEAGPSPSRDSIPGGLSLRVRYPLTISAWPGVCSILAVSVIVVGDARMAALSAQSACLVPIGFSFLYALITIPPKLIVNRFRFRVAGRLTTPLTSAGSDYF